MRRLVCVLARTHWAPGQTLKCWDPSGENTLEEGLRRLKACSDATPQDHVVVAYSALYIFFQAFLIPGPNLLLSVFAGALFPNFAFGTFMVAFSCTAGAVISYILASLLMGPVVERAIPARVAAFRARIAANRDNLFFYLLFLRLVYRHYSLFSRTDGTFCTINLTT